MMNNRQDQEMVFNFTGLTQKELCLVLHSVNGIGHPDISSVGGDLPQYLAMRLEAEAGVALDANKHLEDAGYNMESAGSEVIELPSEYSHLSSKVRGLSSEQALFLLAYSEGFYRCGVDRA